jgi:hypothetical protein
MNVRLPSPRRPISGTLPPMQAATTSRQSSRSRRLAPWSPALLAAGVAVALGCRIQSPGAYWIEAHGDGRAQHVAGRPAGVVAVGADQRLWIYPTDYARPWRQIQAETFRAVTASTAAIYVITASGEVSRSADGPLVPYGGSVGWGSTALAASEDDHLFVVVGGKAHRVEGEQLQDAPCGDITAAGIAAGGGSELYVVDGMGRLHRGDASGCAPVETPVTVRQVAVNGGRVVMVGTDGSVWRRRGADPWHALPPAIRYRPGSLGVKVLAAEVGLSTTCTWLLDRDGNVFVLSDEA